MTKFRLTRDDLSRSQVYYSNGGRYYAQGELPEYKTTTQTRVGRSNLTKGELRPKNVLSQRNTGWSPGIGGEISFNANPNVPVRNNIQDPNPNPIVRAKRKREDKNLPPRPKRAKRTLASDEFEQFSTRNRRNRRFSSQ